MFRSYCYFSTTFLSSQWTQKMIPIANEPWKLFSIRKSSTTEKQSFSKFAVSEDLQDIIGVKEVFPLGQAFKLFWKYIKENNLQDENNRRFIICDEKLEKLTGKKKFNGTIEMEYFIQANLSDTITSVSIIDKGGISMNKRKAPDVLIRAPPDNNPNQDLVDFLRELANYEKDVSKNLFKSHAYRKAAGELARFPERITSGAEAKKLDGIGKVIAFKIDEFLQTGIFSTITTIEDLRNDQDKTLAKERKNGLKNLPDKDGFVASNALDSHLTGNPNYDPDTFNVSDAELHAKWFDDHLKTKKDEEYHNEMSVSDDFNAILESETAIPVNDIPKAKIVYYDLETTGLDPKTQHDGIEILQCSAVCENDVFNKYIVPFGGISEGASNINGLKKHKNQLKLNGNVLHDAFKTPKEGLTSFVDFLKNLGSNEVILVSHNNLNYDSVVLLKNLNQWDITLPQYVKFVDSMDIMNNLRKSTAINLPSITLKNSLQYLCGKEQNNSVGQHDGLDDAYAVKDICNEASKRLGYSNYRNYLHDNAGQVFTNMKLRPHYNLQELLAEQY